ncbi:Protein NDH-DEPENDENT CYCLIC ELECTRON FLOW 5 [Glycine soja]
MALSSLFGSSRFIPTPFVTSTRNIPSSAHTCASNNKREFPLPPVASVPYQPINNFAYLQEEFSGHAGVTFEGVEDNGAEKWKHCDHDDAKWIDHLIKAPMWHGGKVELLHTNVSEGEYGDAIIQGGVSLNFNFQTHDDGEFSWSPTNWLLHKIQGNANEYIQDGEGQAPLGSVTEVELTNRTSDDKIGLKYIVTLEQDALNSELEISNKKSLPVQMTGSILSHLTGRRNSVSVGRNGFDEMYLFSPGSEVEIYSKYSCICVGQAAILKPIILSPEGGQYIHNPNPDA